MMQVSDPFFTQYQSLSIEEEGFMFVLEIKMSGSELKDSTIVLIARFSFPVKYLSLIVI
jgi:hypothetical protein